MKVAEPKQPKAPKRIVGVTKAAKYAGVSRWTLRTWITEGRIPFIQYPGSGRGAEQLRSIKVDLDDLDTFIERAKDRNG